MALREIIFRGKRLNKGEWVEGFFAEKKDPLLESDVRNAFILAQARGDFFATWFPVDPSTVGQFTGLLDKNGKRIFEGDIVKYTFDNPDSPNATENGKKVIIGRVFFSDWRASFSVTAGRNCSSGLNNDLFKYVRNGNRVEVIGNIHDNRELLEGD